MPLLCSCGGCASATTHERLSLDPVDQRASPIWGGQVSSDWPAVAALLYNDEPICSGVLVGAERLVTAAHCVYGLAADLDGLSAVFAPSVIEAGDAQRVGVDEVRLHPDYGTNPGADVALLELSGPPPVGAIPWRVDPLGDEDLGIDLELVAFGRTAPGSTGSAGVRRSTTVQLAELNETRLRWQDPEHGICDADSGGAAFAEGAGGPELVGLLVEGDPGCEAWGAALRMDALDDFLASDPGVGDDDGFTLPGDDDAGPDDGEAGDPGCGGGGAGLAWLLALGAPWGRSSAQHGRGRSRRWRPPALVS